MPSIKLQKRHWTMEVIRFLVDKTHPWSSLCCAKSQLLTVWTVSNFTKPMGSSGANSIRDRRHPQLVTFWNQNLTPETSNRLIALAIERNQADEIEEQTRQAITTKHDKARILHLRADPRLLADWTNALREKKLEQILISTHPRLIHRTN